MRPHVATAALVALLTPTCLAAQGASTPFDARVNAVFSAVSLTTTPGCALGVDRDGAPLLRRAYGMANLETATPFTVHTISESGSTAKQFVAAGLVMLAREGVLSLDDDISKWIPEVKGIGKRITVRQLLSHTSGLPDRYTLHDVQGRAAGDVDHTNAEVMDIVAQLRHLNFDPGEDYLYSNTGYVVAVAVLERASGKSLQAFSQERIFGPLGMTDTRWREDHRVVVPGRASAYSGTALTGFRNEHPFTRVFGSGGLLLTVDDFLKWSAAMQTGTGSWGAIRDSLEAVIRLNDGTALTYGLGVSTDRWRGVRRVSHTGATGGYRAALFRYPEQAVSVALLCNGASANTTTLVSNVAAIVLGEKLAPVSEEVAPAIAVTPEALSALAGRYHAPRTGDALILEVRAGQLTDSLSGARLDPWGAGRFRVRGTQTYLSVKRAGDGTSLTETTPNARAVEYSRVAAPATGPALASYAGQYRSPELGTTMTFVARGDTLLLDRGWRGMLALRPVFRDAFATPDGERIRFTRDTRSRVNGYVVWAGRVRQLRYERAAVR